MGFQIHEKANDWFRSASPASAADKKIAHSRGRIRKSQVKHSRFARNPYPKLESSPVRDCGLEGEQDDQDFRIENE